MVDSHMYVTAKVALQMLSNKHVYDFLFIYMKDP